MVAKSETKKLEKEADRILQTKIVAENPECEICHHPTECGHHFIEKSKSNRLRYEMTNIIPVCSSCHTKIHNRFSYSLGAYDIIDFIIKKRGQKWRDRLEVIRREAVHTTPQWYEEQIVKLKS